MFLDNISSKSEKLKYEIATFEIRVIFWEKKFRILKVPLLERFWRGMDEFQCVWKELSVLTGALIAVHCNENYDGSSKFNQPNSSWLKKCMFRFLFDILENYLYQKQSERKLSMTFFDQFIMRRNLSFQSNFRQYFKSEFLSNRDINRISNDYRVK